MIQNLFAIFAFFLGIMYSILGLGMPGLPGVAYAILGTLFLILGFVIEIAKTVKKAQEPEKMKLDRSPLFEYIKGLVKRPGSGNDGRSTDGDRS